MTDGESQSPGWGQRILAMAPDVANDIRRHGDESHLERGERSRGVRYAIERQYADQFRALDHVVFALEQHGVLMLKRIDDVAEDEHTPVRSALALIQSAATMTVQEIGDLASAGYWVGAAARWRALHELAVTARLVAEGGAEIAQRYLDHGFVVQTRRFLEYRKRHGVGPLSQTELDARSRQAAELEERHEIAVSRSRFRDGYGWAIPLLPLDKTGQHLRATFDRLEAVAGYDARRLLVVSAHGMVHNDAAGVRSAVLMDEGYSMGPLPAFTKTVLQPTFETVSWIVAATHTCFEPTLDSEFARLLSMQGAGLMHLASDAMHSFDP